MHPEVRLTKVAARQHHVFTYGQARDCGFGRGAVAARVARGLWIRIFRAVYLPVTVPRTWKQDVMASLLACGPRSVASHMSALAVWGLIESIVEPHVITPTTSRRQHDGIVVHRAAELEAVTRRGFRVTSPRQTLLDVAGLTDAGLLARALDHFHRQRLVHLDPLKAFVDRPQNLTRPRSALLRRLIAERNPSRAIASEGETEFLEILRRAGLPLPVPQYRVQTRTRVCYIDFAYPDQMLAIEIDGGRDHYGLDAFDADHLRQEELEELGWRFRHFTGARLRTDALGVVTSVARALGLEPARWRPARRRSGE